MTQRSLWRPPPRTCGAARLLQAAAFARAGQQGLQLRIDRIEQRIGTGPAQVAARALEVKYGLEELESSKAERSTRGYDPAEREAQARGRARAKYERARADQPSTTPAWELLDGNDRQARIHLAAGCPS